VRIGRRERRRAPDRKHLPYPLCGLVSQECQRVEWPFKLITTLTAPTATPGAALAGMNVGAIGRTIQIIAGNPLPGSASTGSGGNAPTTGGGKKLIRYGSPDTAEKLAVDAARAEATIGYHGVSAMLRNPPSFPHGQADVAEAAKFFQIAKTGTNPSHYTVILPKPVTQEVADLFNSIFASIGS